MEMEDHHSIHHHPQQYGMADLRQLMNGAPRSTAPHFPSIPPQQPAAELFQPHRNLTPSHHQHYDMMMFGRHVADVMPRSLHDFASDSPPAAAAQTNNITVATPATTASAFTPPLSGLEAETQGCLAGDASTGRWPRQETLTLLEIRSRLDPKFKEANQKGPLWDKVSRIMSEEYGYQRSGKKCREKFENLYKYYKKTKEGKARRQDGKHYRFFRQLEALYGGNNNSTSVPETNYGSNGIGFQTPSQTNHDMFQSHNHKTCDSLSLTNSTDFGTSSSEDNNHLCSMEDDSTEKGRKRSSRWKAKIKEFIDSRMKKLIERQEAWMDKLVKTLEQKEKERVLREEEWRRQEATRLEMEHKFRAKERAWIEARDAALMDAMQKLTGREVKAQSPVAQALIMASEIQNHRENQNEAGGEILNGSHRGVDNWSKSEVTRLLESRAEMESGFQQSGCSEEVMWEEVANKMACFGYERTALMCKHKWGSITSYTNATKEGTRKRKEKSRSCFYFDSNINDQPSLYNHGTTTPFCDIKVNDQRQDNERLQTNDGSSPSNSNAVAADVNCFPFFISTEGSENLWENYGLKINKGNQNQ